tara:strand:- start:23 stop:166 length:144 start_codon:yes stop_codon:yes gene_type:complete
MQIIIRNKCFELHLKILLNKINNFQIPIYENAAVRKLVTKNEPPLRM